MHLFHCPELGTDLVDLPAEEAHHAFHVLRLRAGTRVGLLDGRGTVARAELAEPGKRGCRALIVERERRPPERKAHIHLAVAPTKQMERFEWFLEKATEIGVDRITPILTSRGERRVLKLERLQKVLIGAMKQSQRAWLPRLDALTPLPLLDGMASQKFFGWCEGEHAGFTSAYDPAREALVLIGPEGDFTSEEAEALRGKGFRAVGLGAARLRTETAALAACTWMSLSQQR